LSTPPEHDAHRPRFSNAATDLDRCHRLSGPVDTMWRDCWSLWLLVGGAMLELRDA
jgi:hypothetical protein